MIVLGRIVQESERQQLYAKERRQQQLQHRSMRHQGIDDWHPLNEHDAYVAPEGKKTGVAAVAAVAVVRLHQCQHNQGQRPELTESTPWL